MKSIVSSFTVFSAALALAPFAATAAPKLSTAAGPSQGDVAAAIVAFNTDAARGGVANTTDGPFANGLRNINWDGVPESDAAPHQMHPDFFNKNVHRGAVFSTPDPNATLHVSAAPNNALHAPLRFGDLDPSYPARFQAFTADKIFGVFGGTSIDMKFFVPGSPDTPATVNGFGAVFCDVDLPNVSAIEYFDAADKSLGKFYAPVADNGFSFVGVYFPDGERVARVRLTLGNSSLQIGHVDTATDDVVAVDDFFYSEPLPLNPDATVINVSTRARLGAGADDFAVTGLVVGGTQPKTFLVRAVGPTLAQLLPGVTIAALNNPQFTVFNGAGQAIVTNDDWGNRPELAQAAARVGAFPLLAGSQDAAALVVLKPGAYTVVTSGGGASGLVLTEIYEVK